MPAKLGNYIIAQCDGVGEAPLEAPKISRRGICRKCGRIIEKRRDGTIRFHGKREPLTRDR